MTDKQDIKDSKKLVQVFYKQANALRLEGFSDAAIASGLLDCAVNIGVENSNYHDTAKWLRQVADALESGATTIN